MGRSTYWTVNEHACLAGSSTARSAARRMTDARKPPLGPRSTHHVLSNAPSKPSPAGVSSRLRSKTCTFGSIDQEATRCGGRVSPRRTLRCGEDQPVDGSGTRSCLTPRTRSITTRITVVVVLALTTILPAGSGPDDVAAAPSGGDGTLGFIVYSPEGLPHSVGRALENVRGVRMATPVILGLDWVLGSRSAAGRRVDDPPDGYGLPIEAVAVEPRRFATFAPPADRAAIRGLGGNRIIIPRSEAEIRGFGDGSTMHLRSGRVRVRHIVRDRSAQAYEIVRSRPAPDRWRYTVRFFLVRAERDVNRTALRRAIERKTRSGIRMRIRSERQTPYLRYAESVRPQVAFKKAFGEFPARPADSGAISILPRWVSSHIRTDSVPLLGSVRCHRRLFRQLRAAMSELQRRGLGHLIRRDEYAGCYNARFVAVPAGTRLSRHSWGIALDVNTNGNAFGQEPHQDRRLVRIMRKWGFAWGGTWPIPDGMHFEWRRFPSY
jgi:hypothetical protein